MTPEQLAKSGSEDAHQMALFAWAATARRDFPQLAWLHAIPNGGLRSARTGAKMKATGARKGVWDVHLPVPRWRAPSSVVTGLYIEMKKPGKGRLTDEQKDYRKHLDFYGYQSVVCFTWEEARDAILNYLDGMSEAEKDQYRNATK